MAQVFDWIRPGYELVTVKLEWNVQVPFLNTTGGYGRRFLTSPLFSSQETPNRKWKLRVVDTNGTQIIIPAFQYNSSGVLVNFVESVLVKMSILDRNGRKLFQQMATSPRGVNGVEFRVSKEGPMKSACQQEDGSFTFCCKIFTHVEIISVSPADPTVLVIDCKCGLSTHLDGLFNSMQFSDVIFKVRGCEFPAHKNILAARSEVFAAMFQHPMEEQSTNLAKIEDIEPEVFNQLLRFIYTGRVQVDKLETMAARLFIAADKYLLDELKNKCENYLLRHMSPENCVVLLLTGDLQNPSMMLMNAAKYFRRFPNEVMATDQWKINKQENLAVLCKIHEFVHSHK